MKILRIICAVILLLIWIPCLILAIPALGIAFLLSALLDINNKKAE